MAALRLRSLTRSRLVEFVVAELSFVRRLDSDFVCSTVPQYQSRRQSFVSLSRQGIVRPSFGLSYCFVRNSLASFRS